MFPAFEILSLIITGYCFEIIGRQDTIYFSLTISGLALFLYPIVSPNLILYVMTSIIWTSSIQPLVINPLIIDYVCQESRGKALALTVMGSALGTLCSFLVLQWVKKEFYLIH